MVFDSFLISHKLRSSVCDERPLRADFVAEIDIPTARDGRRIFLKPSIVTRWIVRATYARLYRRLQRLRSAQRGEWWRPGDQLGQPTEVLRNRRQRELELGTAWPAQSQPAEPQDTLQVRKQHFDTLPVAG